MPLFSTNGQPSIQSGGLLLPAFLMRKYLGPLLFGFGGFLTLMGLGIWQLDRLGQKLERIALMEARLGAQPLSELPAAPNRQAHDFLRLQLKGTLSAAPAVRVLSAREGRGPGHQHIHILTLEDNRRILLDRGFLPYRAETAPVQGTRVGGFLRWPREKGLIPRQPLRNKNIWFDRDVAAIAAHLGTEPVLLVSTQQNLGGLPVPASLGIDLPNNHRQYAFTWFATGLFWLLMTLFWLRVNTHTDTHGCEPVDIYK